MNRTIALIVITLLSLTAVAEAKPLKLSQHTAVSTTVGYLKSEFRRGYNEGWAILRTRRVKRNRFHIRTVVDLGEIGEIERIYTITRTKRRVTCWVRNDYRTATFRIVDPDDYPDSKSYPDTGSWCD